MEYKENQKQEKSAVYQEADVSSKRIFGNHTLCAQFLRDYSGLPVLTNVQPEDIEDVSERYHLFREVELEADTVKKVHLRGLNGQTDQEEQDIYIISLIEHKSTVDYDVTMQILRYMVCIWDNIAKEQGTKYKRKDFRYPPIYPIIYYEGAGEWTSAKNLKDRILMLLNKIQLAQDFQELSGLSSERLNDILRRAPVDVVEIIAATIRDLCEKLNLPTEETSTYVRKVRDGNMGYLFENMEKMDIQLERRNTIEQRERAEKAEQRAEEAEQKAGEAYRMLMNSYQQQGLDKEAVKQRLISEGLMDESEVDELLEMFWNS